MSIPMNKTANVNVESWYFVQVGDVQMMLTASQAHALLVALNGLFGQEPTVSERLSDLDAEVSTLREETENERGALWTEMDGRYAAISEHMAAQDAQIAAMTAHRPAAAPSAPAEDTPDAPISNQEQAPVALPVRDRPRWESPPFTPDETETVQALVAAGQGSAEIAVTLDRTTQSVRREIERRIAPALQQPEAENPYRIAGQGLSSCGIEKLRELGEGGFSTREMAAAMGIPKGSIEYYLSKYDLRRTRTFAPPDPVDHEPEPPAAPELQQEDYGLIARRHSATKNNRAVADALAHLVAAGMDWTQMEDALLASTMNTGGTISQAALLLKRTGAEVRLRWVSLCREVRQEAAAS